MKNEKEKISKKNNFNTRPLFLAIFFIVVLIAIYLSLQSSQILLNPEDTSLSLETARSILSKMIPEGIEWYCGRIESYVDEQGNIFNQKSLEELKKILGNDEQLREEFCHN